jgi:hypothetical protein
MGLQEAGRGRSTRSQWQLVTIHGHGRLLSGIWWVCDLRSAEGFRCRLHLPAMLELRCDCRGKR